MSIHAGLRLVSSAPDVPHSTAQRVMEILADGKKDGLGLAAMRRHYNISRRQFLGEAVEPVESVFHIFPAERGVPRLTIIRPQGFRTGDRLPALVFMHGGGWTLGSLATYEPFCRQLANACNMIVIWVEYRLAPEAPFPAAYDDTLAAWRWVGTNYAELGADPARIMIGGDSAGGNLAAAAALRLRADMGIQPWRQILLYPCLDLSASQPSHRKFAEGYLLTAPLSCLVSQQLSRGSAYGRLASFTAFCRRSVRPAARHSALCRFRSAARRSGRLCHEADAGGCVSVETLYFADMIHGFLTMGGAIPAAHAAVARIADALSTLNH